MHNIIKTTIKKINHKKKGYQVINNSNKKQLTKLTNRYLENT